MLNNIAWVELFLDYLEENDNGELFLAEIQRLIFFTDSASSAE
jgi:hypothetical protein